MKKIYFLYRKFHHIFVLMYIIICMIIGWYACTSDSDNKVKDTKSVDSLKNQTTPKNDSLNSKIGIDIIGKEFQSSSAADPKDYVVIIYKLINNTNKSVRAVEADVIIYDASGNEVKKLKITDNELMDAGAEKQYKALYNYNAFSDKDVALKNVELKNIKFKSNVLKITYQDGTTESR